MGAAADLRAPAAAGLPVSREAQAGSGPARGQALPEHRDPAACRGSAQRPSGPRGDQPRYGVRPGGRRGPGALRGAAARRDAGRQHALHPAGQHRADVASREAAARQAPEGGAVQAGIVGAEGGRRLVAKYGGWHGPGCRRERGEGERSERVAAPERRGALSLPTDRRLRLPLQLSHGGPDRAGRGDRLAVRSALRLAERLRHAARPRGWTLPARALRHQRAVRAVLRARDECPRHHLEDAHRLGRRPRRADDGPVGR